MTCLDLSRVRGSLCLHRCGLRTFLLHSRGIQSTRRQALARCWCSVGTVGLRHGQRCRGRALEVGLTNSLKSPLQVRLKPPTPPMFGIFARRSHFESWFTRFSWSCLAPSYLTPVLKRVAIRADTSTRKVGIIRDWASRDGLQGAV